MGSPRSGTTLLENILNVHPQIAELYEPYYIWERFFSVTQSDLWDINELTEDVRRRIQKDYLTFREKSNKAVVLDKTPTHSFNIPLILNVFPDSRWIHILRDGRDVTLSIRREWEKRNRMVREKNYGQLLARAYDMLRRQPLWSFRFMALSHELRSNFSLSPRKYLNKSRWQGKEGWGPRFEGWRDYLEKHTPLEFNAMQWVASVQAVRKHWEEIPKSNRIEITYEHLLANPRATLRRVLEFLNVDAADSDFYSNMPAIRQNNTNKWREGFSPEEISAIRSILSPLLGELGYEKSVPW